MTEKVKVTQKQFDWLERYELTQEQVDHCIDIQPLNKRPDSPIVDWSASRVARALYIGYEVEPKYYVGDWIVHTVNGNVARINHHGIDSDGCAWVDDKDFNFFEQYRHATESEIAQEKKRRFWSKHGRGVGEYRLHDIVRALSGGIGEITAFESKGIDESLIELNDCASFKTERIKLVCPVENRLDISHE